MRVKSGIEGLDELIEGGLPDGTVSLITGPAGSGKTLIGTQYIYKGAKEHNSPGLIISMEEGRSNLLRAARRYNMDLEEMEKDGLHLLDVGALRAMAYNGKDMEDPFISFKALKEIIRTQVEEKKIERLVVDSISALGLYYSSDETLRKELFDLCRFLKELDITTLLISEVRGKGDKQTVEEFVSDAIITLGYENVNGEYRRTVTVYKMRFTRHDPYKHPFLITKNGIEIDFEEIIL